MRKLVMPVASALMLSAAVPAHADTAVLAGGCFWGMETVFEQFALAARRAQELGLGVNAGHDLNLENLGKFCSIPGIAEVSIGHALISDALELGLFNAVQAYLKVIKR